MGACLSGNKGGLEAVDDSVHVMLTHDRKRKARSGQAPAAYKPRAANPALTPKEPEEAKVEEAIGGG